MGYLTNLIKKINIPKISIKNLLSTSTMASAYTNNNYYKIGKLLRKGKKYYKRIKFNENHNYSLLHQAVIDNNVPVIDIILQQKYSKDKDVIEDIDNELGLAPVQLACLNDNVEVLKDLINKGNSGIHIKTKTEELGLLHISARFGTLQTLEFVYKNFYLNNINCLSEEEWTALHFACFMNKFDACSFLIDHKADLYVRNKQFLTPLETCILNDHFELFYILFNHHYDIHKLYSFNHPEAAKPVHIAACCKKGTRILEYLLEDPNNVHEICNSSIRATPLHFSSMQNNPNSVRVILRKDVNVNFQDYLGNTALHYAMENGNLEIIKMLHDSGADGLKKNNEGLTPYEIAIQKDNRDTKIFVLGLDRYKNYLSKDRLKL